MLRFIYIDELDPSSAEEAQHLMAAADHYVLTQLVAICAAHLSTTLTVDNAADTLTLATQHGAEGLKAAALKFVAENGLAVVKTAG